MVNISVFLISYITSGFPRHWLYKDYLAKFIEHKLNMNTLRASDSAIKKAISYLKEETSDNYYLSITTGETGADLKYEIMKNPVWLSKELVSKINRNTSSQKISVVTIKIRSDYSTTPYDTKVKEVSITKCMRLCYRWYRNISLNIEIINYI